MIGDTLQLQSVVELKLRIPLEFPYQYQLTPVIMSGPPSVAAKQAVFVGDSLIQWFTHHKYWQQYFTNNYNCINLGVPGISTQETINRLPRVLDTHPDLLPQSVAKVCPLLIGTNDIGLRYGEEYIANNIKSIIEIIETKLVNVQVLLIGIIPRGHLSEMPFRVNQLLSTFLNIRYLDLTDQFCQVDPKTMKVSLHKKLYSPDQLHLSSEGYRVWAEAMCPIFKEMMKN